LGKWVISMGKEIELIMPLGNPEISRVWEIGEKSYESLIGSYKGSSSWYNKFGYSFEDHLKVGLPPVDMRELYEFFEMHRIIVYYYPVFQSSSNYTYFNSYIATSEHERQACFPNSVKYEWEKPDTKFPTRVEAELAAFGMAFEELEKRLNG
jgi:hypothetical protein